MNIYLYVNDQQTGPYSEDQLRSMLASGAITPAQLAWHDSLTEWQPLNTILSTAPVPPPRPPPPPKLKRGLIHCKACGNPVSKNAKACPSCGAPNKRRSSCGGCAGLILLFIVLGAIASVFTSKEGAAGSSVPVETPVAAKPEVTQTPPLPNATEASTPAPAPTPLPTEWTTTDGKTYKNVTIVSHDAATVTIDSADGMATFPISHLDKDIQEGIADDHITAKDWNVNGKTYANVKVVKSDVETVTILVADGGATIDLGDLPPDLQKKFDYDPAQAKAAKESRAKAEAEQAKTLAEQAKVQAEEDKRKGEQDAFVKTLKAFGVDNTIVKSVVVNGDRLTIVVTENFHSAPYQTRLQVAQNFEKLWASIHPPNKGNITSPLKITDYNGNEVGGTGFTGVWVQKP